MTEPKDDEREALHLRITGASYGEIALHQSVTPSIAHERVAAAIARHKPPAGEVTVRLLGRSNGDIAVHFEVEDTRRGRSRRDGLRVTATHGGGRVVENWSGTQWREMVRFQARDLEQVNAGLRDIEAASAAWQRVYG